MPFTRRHLLHAAVVLPPFAAVEAASKEFWNSKDPAAWGAEEKQQLLSGSPWAHVGTLRFGEKAHKEAPVDATAHPGAGVPGARPNSTPGTGAPVGSVPIGEPVPPPPSTGKGDPPQFRALVRWESAQPVRLAAPRKLPEETAEFYVINLIGMPLLRARPGKDGQPGPNPNLGMLDAIKATSRIERKNKSPLVCSHLLAGEGDAVNELLLFFPRGTDPITLADKEVTVVSRFGPFQLAVKFTLKEMVFGGVPAL